MEKPMPTTKVRRGLYRRPSDGKTFEVEVMQYVEEFTTHEQITAFFPGSRVERWEDTDRYVVHVPLVEGDRPFGLTEETNAPWLLTEGHWLMRDPATGAGTMMHPISFQDSVVLDPEKMAPVRSQGAALIAFERERQIDKGYTPEHDRAHTVEDLLDAAKAYLITARGEQYPLAYWPFNGGFKPEGTKEDLVKAGAFIAAAIDRIQIAHEKTEDN